MDSKKYIGMDVHKESISIAVMNGAGLGASHQTGWTGLVAKIIELYGFLDPERGLRVGRDAAFTKPRIVG